ncbi:MAG TPA: MlaE family lipid ABC transporter permease subunit [Steroidobacteraceae bacterium]|nr:MlaE family lipid ABC transporter permease subunit [Steroidobacteraceae bacterium]
MAGELLEQARTGDALTVRLNGAWRIENIVAIEAALAQLSQEGARRVVVDTRSLEALDLSGAWLLHARLQALQGEGGRIEFAGSPPSQFAFLEEITSQPAEQSAVEPGPPRSWHDAIAWIGRTSVQQMHQSIDAVGYLGRITVTGLRSLRPRHLRAASVTRHIYETGIQAIPIVSLIAFLISVIIAYLSAQQLRQFGAEIFTVDLVAIAVLREMGVLLTAIIVAGRSGSAFAAEIGVMRLNDEIDALHSMGVDPFEVLVLPRLIGLLISLPLLTIVADAMGLAGGALLSSLLLDISLTQFIPRLQDALAPTTFWAGLIKAPVFAALIALVGTYRGMQVRDSSRELGRLTTVAVVQSIFLVIFADAVFAVVFVELDF